LYVANRGLRQYRFIVMDNAVGLLRNRYGPQGEY
jgi:hypothetical protein